MSAANGYAVKTKDGIDLRTVSETQVGAAVNYLWNNGVRVTNDWSDEKIIGTFEMRRLMMNDAPEIVRVQVTEVGDGQG